MTHLDIFGQFRPFAIGFDRYFEDLERMSNISQTNYPPYNVVKVDESISLLNLQSQVSVRKISLSLKRKMFLS